MAATFLIVPQWQGSGSSRAMQLIDGADAIAGDLPVSVTRRLEITLGAGESLGTGVARVSVLRSIRDDVTRAVTSLAEPPNPAEAHDDSATPAEPANEVARPDLVVTIGGDCGVELAPIVEAKRLHPDLAVVWLDAHADLLAPDPAGSGPFSSMVLRTLLGDGTELLVPDFAQTLSPSRVILAGVRSLDDDEQAYIQANQIVELSVDALQQSEELERGNALVGAITVTGATEVYLHVDLDVLDPAEITGLSYPEPFGLTVAALVENIVAVRRSFTVVGAAITQFAPASPDAASDDLSAVLRVISALTRAL